MRHATLLPLLALSLCVACDDDGSSADPENGRMGAQPGDAGNLPVDENPGTDAGDDPPPPDEPLPPGVEPMALTIDAPPRGARLTGPTIQVIGRLTGGEAPALTVAGQPIVLDAEGRFTTSVDVTPGMNVLVSEAVDGNRQTDDRRGFLVDADVDPATAVDDALTATVGRTGFEGIAALLTGFLRTIDYFGFASEQLPENITLDRLVLTDITLDLKPRSDVLEATLVVEDLRVQLSGTLTRGGVTVEFDGSARTDVARLVARITAAAAPDGGLDLGVANATVELTGFTYDISQVPDWAEELFAGTVEGFVEDFIAGALEDFVVPSLFDPAALERQFEVLGNTIEVGLSVGDVALRSSGLTLFLDARAEAGAVVHAGRAVRGTEGAPQSDASQDLDVGIAAELLSRIFHAAWAAGLLDFRLDAEAELDLPLPLTVALLGSALGEAGEGIDRSTPLVITTRPLLPAVVRVEKSDKPIVVEVADLMLDIGTADGPLVTVALHLLARADIQIDSLESFALQPDFDVEVAVDVAETPAGRVNEKLLEEQLEALGAALPAALADQSFAIGEGALPVPVGLFETRVEADERADYIHLRASIAE